MARGALTFRQRDVTAAVRAVAAAGCAVVRVEVGKSGKIVIHTDQHGAERPSCSVKVERNEWDDA